MSASSADSAVGELEAHLPAVRTRVVMFGERIGRALGQKNESALETFDIITHSRY
jgi:hypothetical protein